MQGYGRLGELLDGVSTVWVSGVGSRNVHVPCFVTDSVDVFEDVVFGDMRVVSEDLAGGFW